jgi:hypothetical protein
MMRLLRRRWRFGAGATAMPCSSLLLLLVCLLGLCSEFLGRNDI